MNISFVISASGYTICRSFLLGKNTKINDKFDFFCVLYESKCRSRDLYYYYWFFLIKFYQKAGKRFGSGKWSNINTLGGHSHTPNDDPKERY